ncbi:hypothetical protein CO178_00580 [candidate division WWE3 bacterium CG_4_9_14_3_um_filter_34_6]|uniref:Prepilin peptidase n=1 Tax=candidate division WWE3 bacterium CG_4_9_14_3_um_filter_34_6 TaxID=1975079 RepID=A0A2M7X514_UNCKA|nr:MAG: hypothetical protein CO178_00580 [candidate division WWE3 bacterium CG_4_9_14_3_um_filter_34_6]
MTVFMLYFAIFLLALFIGSFLNVVVDRVYRGEQFLKGRSYCEFCKYKLELLDLMPVLSFIYTHGKCRHCGVKIPIKHPLIEVTTALVITFGLYLLNPASFIEGVFFVILISTLLLIFFTDLLYYVIPDIYLYILFGLYFVFAGGFYFLNFTNLFIANLYVNPISHFISALIVGGFFALLHFGSRKKAMGEGDIYLGAILALFLGGWMSVVMLYVSFLTGAFVGVILILLRKKRFGQAVPFGPFLIFGFIVANLVGSNLINLYLRLL